ncbi:hypothetical protein EYR36_007979 [Pleurotus pulmonarius]|nr:hypothetical protein EYR36_007979 [Pleurotus pulmonarius]
MARPRPLQLASGTPKSSDYQNLTPRTPHSRAGRAEEAFSDIELTHIHEADEDYQSPQQQQSKPLLTSSRDGYRSRGDEYDGRHHPGMGQKRWTFARVVSLLPLILGALTGLLLLFLIFASVQRPETLHKIVGAIPPSEGAVGAETSPAQQADPVVSLVSPPAPPPPPPQPSQHANSTATHTVNLENLISYENYTTFPLKPDEYRAECSKHNSGFMKHFGGFWDVPMHGPVDVSHAENDRVCKSTITYMLDGKVGLLADLALMAQVAAMARERNRTFFVDDTYWDRGKWADYFIDVRKSQPGEEPDCLPPPPNELVACPRGARHWVINSRTAKYHLGHPFSETYENAYGHGLHRLKPIFNMARDSFSKTILPNERMHHLINLAREAFQKKMAGTGASSSYLGVHIRRGDRKASSWKYHGQYLPTSEYVSAVADTWPRVSPPSTVNPTDSMPSNPFIYLASDSPEGEGEFTSSVHAENVFSLARSQSPELAALASPMDYVQGEFDQLTLPERAAATKGMIVDFALVSGMWAADDGFAPEATICGISSSVCRMSAVALGWDRAFGELGSMGDIDETGKRWVEIDEHGTIVPVWQPFELFR